MEGVDISHLSLEEQNILRNVFARQQDEETREEQIFRKSQADLHLLEEAINIRRREKRFDLHATCNICFKTKFADGVGHICQQCGVRCCARCGCKVPLKKNKIWLCILCRKKKELAIKFGKWLQNDRKESWGRSRSLEEDSERRLDAGGFLSRQFTSSLNITTPNLPPFWQEEKKDPQKPERPEPLRYEMKSAQSYITQQQQQRKHRRRSSLEIRNDSLSSDQSENPPARPKPRKSGNGGHRQRRDGPSSGSEDDARSTPSSCRDSESEIYKGNGHRRHPCHRTEPPHVLRSRPWDGGDGNTKDSGIDTSSSATLYEDTQQHNVFWSRSKGGGYIGNMVLKKELGPDGRTRQNVGMRVVGGQIVEGIMRAIVENIREGSLADRIARIEPGDEVVEWNGVSFRGRRKEEVANIIAISKNDPQVQLLIHRPCGRNAPNVAEELPCDLRRIPPPHLEVHPEAMNRGGMFHDHHQRYYSRYSSSRRSNSVVGGQIQVKLSCDHQNSHLLVTVECAKRLPPRLNTEPRSPYCKVVLLPNRPGEQPKKGRSIAVLHSNEPQWHDTVRLSDLRLSQIKHRMLQITVWDYSPKGELSEFLGEVVIPLRSSMNNEPQWYLLSMHRDNVINPSPPESPDRRLSDDDLSDFDEKFSERTERRMMAIDSCSPFYEGIDRQPYEMGGRSRSLNSPPISSSDYPRGRIRETGFEDRRRSRSMADSSERRTPVHGSRSVSPPQYRAAPFHHSRRLLPAASSSNNQYRKRQLPQVPFSRIDIEERYMKKGKNPAVAVTPPSGAEFPQRRGGGSRMAAALGVSSSLVSPDDSESSSKFSLSSAFHRNSRTLGEFTGRSSAYGGPVHPSSRDAEMDGSLSDTAVGLATDNKTMIRRPSTYSATPYLSKKSNSTSQLSVTGGDRLSGMTPSPTGTVKINGRLWGSRLLPEAGEGFVEGLGPGQLVGRQVLASPTLGEIQLAICERKSCLEVEVIRARGLMPNPNAKTLPAPYVKVYLLDGGRKCVAKRKTATARRTLDPLYQQQLLFSEDFRNCVLQVTVWGNYSNIERKVFMGVSQIVLDDIDLAKGVINWYKLFHQSSLVNNLTTSNDRSSFLSLDSFG
ncbi:regulating synaptic membrane exocytosis protein 2 isoform X3 [Parasteatoda tepidariorum]